MEMKNKVKSLFTCTFSGGLWVQNDEAVMFRFKLIEFGSTL